MNTFIQQEWIKSDCKYVFVVTKYNILNKGCTFELSIHQRILKNMLEHQI